MLRKRALDGASAHPVATAATAAQPAAQSTNREGTFTNTAGRVADDCGRVSNPVKTHSHALQSGPISVSISRIVVFLLVVNGISAAIHSYLWWRLVSTPAWPAPWSRILGGVLIAGALAIPLTFIASRSFPKEVATPLALLAAITAAAAGLLPFASAAAIRINLR